MTLQRQGNLLRRHAAAIIGDFDPVATAAAQRHSDPRRARVDRILNQLLQRAGWSFHHFTGRDPVDEMLGQAAY